MSRYAREVAMPDSTVYVSAYCNGRDADSERLIYSSSDVLATATYAATYLDRQIEGVHTVSLYVNGALVQQWVAR